MHHNMSALTMSVGCICANHPSVPPTQLPAHSTHPQTGALTYAASWTNGIVAANFMGCSA